MQRFKGSTWRRWDLHIHCPTSILNNQFEGANETVKWQKYLQKLESVGEWATLGITDYFSFDGYKKLLEFKQQGRISNIQLLLPNVELRLLPVTSSDRPINLHIIFSPEIVCELETLFFSNLEFEYNENRYKCLHDDLIRFGRTYSNDQALDPNCAYREGVSQFKITIKDLNDVFRKNKKLKENSITGVSNSSRDGGSGIQHSSLAATREEVYRFAQFIFSGNPNDRDYFIGKGRDPKEEIIRKYGALKPCINGSDAHSLPQVCNPDMQRFTWIKADPTFEGLRQILYEPEYRVIIGTDEPIHPPIRIDRVDFDFPDDSNIETDPFCLSGLKTINFSPYFTCIIGGRGTGKSMILNLMHEKLRPGQNNFFKEKSITNQGGDKLNIGAFLKVDNDADEKYIEFLSQNEVVAFAQNYQKLTDAIYNRILKRDEESRLTTLEDNLKVKLHILEQHVNHKKSVQTKSVLLAQKRKELETQRKIVDSFASEEYKEITQKIKDCNKETAEIDFSKRTLDALLSNVKKNLEEFSDTSTSNAYDAARQKIAKQILDIINQAEALEFPELQKKRKELENELKVQKEKMKSYLSDKGLTEENLKDISTANLNINSLETGIDILEKEIQKDENSIAQFSIEDVQRASEEYADELKNHVSFVSNTLEKLNSSFVKPIRLKLEFDIEACCEKILDDFKNIFQEQITTANIRGDVYLKECLFTCSPEKIDKKADYLENLLQKNSKSISKDFLVSLFSDETNFEIYKLIAKQRTLDKSAFKKISVLYDNQTIGNTSFGQRCTATLVILLLLGNNPIIIDEPEAHLDSLLISNYLVEVIKEKKLNRQIIFATHNANFVINGDAELIHILTMNDDKKTMIKGTTIENLDTRETLIGLEGGREAFIKRENRYQFPAE